MKNFLAVLVITSCLQTTLFATTLGITPAYAATYATFDARSEDISEVAELLLKGYVVVFPMNYLQGHEFMKADYVIAGSVAQPTTDGGVNKYLLKNKGEPLSIFQAKLPVWVPLWQKHMLDEAQREVLPRSSRARCVMFQ